MSTPISALTRRTFRCPDSDYTFEVEQPLSAPSQALCPLCGEEAVRYFGGQSVPPMNLGWRGPHGYATDADARIAQYQFEHL